MTLPQNLSLTVNLNYSALTSYDKNVMAATVFVFVCAAIPAFIFAINVCLFRRPGRAWNKRLLPPVSVLIPARDEEGRVGATVEHLYVELRLHGIEHEIVVVDDGSPRGDVRMLRHFGELKHRRHAGVQAGERRYPLIPGPPGEDLGEGRLQLRPAATVHLLGKVSAS